MINRINFFLISSLYLTLISDSLRLISWSDLSFNLITYFTVTAIFLAIFSIMFVNIKSRPTKLHNYKIKNILHLWLFIIFVNFLRGLFLSNSYFDYKFLLLNALPFSLSFLIFYIGNKIIFFKKIIFSFIKILFPLSIFSLAFFNSYNDEVFSRLLIPLTFILLLTPYLDSKKNILIFVFILSSILVNIEFRTNIIKYLISFAILSTFFFKTYRKKRILFFIQKLFFIIPIFLLIVNFFYSFNIFEVLQKNESSLLIENNLNIDTRTFLYYEVLNSFNSIFDLIFGKGSSGHIFSNHFNDFGGAIGSIRYKSEVNILNIILHYGIIGVIVFFLLLYYVSYFAIKNSKNHLGKMCGLLIASKWTTSFIEEFTQYDLNFYFIWLFIGLSSSTNFISLDDNQLKSFLK